MHHFRTLYLPWNHNVTPNCCVFEGLTCKKCPVGQWAAVGMDSVSRQCHPMPPSASISRKKSGGNPKPLAQFPDVIFRQIALSVEHVGHNALCAKHVH